MNEAEMVNEIAEALSAAMRQLEPGIAAKYNVESVDAYLTAALDAVCSRQD